MEDIRDFELKTVSIIRPIFLIFLSYEIQMKHQSVTIPEHQSTYVEPQYITSHHNNTKCSMYTVTAKNI
jgi:hypothetical protein